MIFSFWIISSIILFIFMWHSSFFLNWLIKHRISPISLILIFRVLNYTDLQGNKLISLTKTNNGQEHLMDLITCLGWFVSSFFITWACSSSFIIIINQNIEFRSFLGVNYWWLVCANFQVGLNNIKETDFVNVTIQSLMRVTPLRNFFLIPENYRHCKSPLVHRFGELTRKIWHARNFKGQVWH